jgi:quercetin dioxygenase-like cupin family protein
MLKIDLNNIELNEFTAVNNPKQKCKASFPLLGVHGTKKSAAVYFELTPGEELGTHTDSAEETLLILEGKVEVTIGSECCIVGKSNLALVPKMIPHNLKNVGESKVKVIGFFGGANNIVATFENRWLPTDSNVVDTSMITS